MCRNNSYYTTADRHLEYYEMDEDDFLDVDDFDDIRDNIVACYDAQPIIASYTREKKQSVHAFWGLIPDNTTEANLGNAVFRARSTVNARAEEVFDKRTYRPLIANHRCLVPSTGYWEYHHDEETVRLKTKAKQVKRKTAMLVRRKLTDIFSIAGLYSVWINPQKPEMSFTSFTMFTIDANEKMRAVHNGGDFPFRMPLILQRKDEKKWIDATISDDEIKHLLSYRIPGEDLDIFPTVSPLKRDKPAGLALYEPIEVPGIDIDLNWLRS